MQVVKMEQAPGNNIKVTFRDGSMVVAPKPAVAMRFPKWLLGEPLMCRKETIINFVPYPMNQSAHQDGLNLGVQII